VLRQVLREIRSRERNVDERRNPSSSGSDERLSEQLSLLMGQAYGFADMHGMRNEAYAIGNQEMDLFLKRFEINGLVSFEGVTGAPTIPA